VHFSHQFVEKVAAAILREFEAATLQKSPAATLGESEAAKKSDCEIPEQQEKLLVAFSGGPDSSALLFALSIIAKRLHWSLEAAHVNHRLRGAESDGDQDYCRDLCARLSVPLHIYQDPRIEEGGSSSEEALRSSRYDFMERTAARIEASVLLTGHTLDDQVETIFFRLIRGTSLSGAAGIAAGRRLESGVFLIRPMLLLTRDEVVQFLGDQSIEARHDRSNQELKYSRNFLRHIVMQPLKERFPGFEVRVQRFADAARIDDDFVHGIACEWYQRLELEHDCWNCLDFKHLHDAVLNRIFVIGLSNRGIEVTNERIDLLVRQIKSAVPGVDRVSFNDRWDVKKEGNHLWWLDKETELLPATFFLVPLRVPGTTIILPLAKAVAIETVTEATGNRPQAFPCEESLEALVDLTALTEQIVLRRRQSADFIQPFGRQEKVSLKKFLHTRKAAAQRLNLRNCLDPHWTVHKCVVLAAGDEVLWIPGIGLSEKLRVRNQPTHRFAILTLASEVTIA
jgi:tRNA(Ile)-lysidine synthase